MAHFFKTILAGLLGIGAIFGGHKNVATTTPSNTKIQIEQTTEVQTEKPVVTTSSSTTKIVPDVTNIQKLTVVSGGTPLTDDQVLALADNKYADGNVPLGDYKYVTDAPKKGYVYLCNARKDNPGSMVTGTWVHGDMWNWNQKVTVDGSVSWPNASFSDLVSAGTRLIKTNALPINHTTGVFPVASTDDAHAFDPNPNTISAQAITKNLPATPTYSETPSCMGGEVGIMLTGVPLFNAFDAGLRDAPAHELQDSCNGHPQGSGEYHYHSDSACFKDENVKTVLGFAYDGFPITGGKVADNKYLTTEDLDVCHGITSTITMDGKQVTTYHYVLTKDFPYSASCFRGKPISQPMSLTPGGMQGGQMQGGQQMQNGQGQMPPPPPYGMMPPH